MKERPILMSAPMVRALLDGRKTQTRRIVQPKHLPWLENSLQNLLDGKWEQRPLPYGRPGDKLWVRETWAQNENQLSDTYVDRSYLYRADSERRALDNGTELPWRPSIHMPRAASRILLELTDVRVERLQDISPVDAIAEGAQFVDFGRDRFGNQRPGWRCDGPPPSHEHALHSPRLAYGNLWERLNGAGSWDMNPWVWVLTFRRVEREEQING